MITDRTQQDVDAAKAIREEKVKAFETLTPAEVETLERGMLTFNTINRIADKQDEVKSLLNSAGYWNTDVINQEWTGNDWHYREDWERILQNEDALKKAFFAYFDTEEVPNVILGYEELNAIESILVDMADMYAEMISQYRKCGTFECGE